LDVRNREERPQRRYTRINKVILRNVSRMTFDNILPQKIVTPAKIRLCRVMAIRKQKGRNCNDNP